ncbi:MAG: hypothetical protein H6816_06345 [Phycisphaerales bacterium]|nr:hypothetical protein [Phycisphaerales bacterium]
MLVAGQTGCGPTALTKADTQGIDGAAFTLPRLIKYRFVRRPEVPAFLYTPQDTTRANQFRFVLSFHSGPGAVSPSFFAAISGTFSAAATAYRRPNVRQQRIRQKLLEMDNYKRAWTA